MTGDGVQVYHPDVELKLNDVVEVTGVYILNPDLACDFDSMVLAADMPGTTPSADPLAMQHPSSLVWHCLLGSFSCSLHGLCARGWQQKSEDFLTWH